MSEQLSLPFGQESDEQCTQSPLDPTDRENPHDDIGYGRKVDLAAVRLIMDFHSQGLTDATQLDEKPGRPSPSDGAPPLNVIAGALGDPVAPNRRRYNKETRKQVLERVRKMRKTVFGYEE